MGSIKERKDKNGKIHFHVQVRMKGALPQNASFLRKTDAVRWIQQTEAAIREGRHFKTSEAKKHTVAELIERYIGDVLPQKIKSKDKQTAQLLWWKNEIGYYLLSDITPAIIAQSRDKLLKGITRRGKVRCNSTVVRYMAALSHAFTIAIKEWGWLDESPIRKVSKPKEPRGRIRFLDDEERASLLYWCEISKNKYLYTIVVLAISTGMRKGEILNLKWEDFDLEKKRIILSETKNGEIRQIPVSGLALDLLLKLDKVRRLDSKLLFPSKWLSEPIDIRTAWENAVKNAGIKNLVFHDLRHSCASYLAMNGATMCEIGAVLGHKSQAMVKRYAHISESHTANVVSKMNDKIFGRIA